MPIDSTLPVDAVHSVIDAIRRGQVCYETGDWLVTVGPEHLATPEARGRLWDTIARLVELEEEVAR